MRRYNKANMTLTVIINKQLWTWVIGCEPRSKGMPDLFSGPRNDNQLVRMRNTAPNLIWRNDVTSSRPYVNVVKVGVHNIIEIKQQNRDAIIVKPAIDYGRTRTRMTQQLWKQL